MTRPAQDPDPAGSPSQGSPDKSVEKGLERLKEAVGEGKPVHCPPRQRPEAIRRRVALCLLWRPEDSLVDFALRHPEHGDAEAAGAKMGKIRTYLADKVKGHHLSGWQIAQRYLAEVHPSYLRSTEP